jgi:glycosyltransferase involved in cell wall biosynthesis
MSNAPWCFTGYGVQTKLMLRELQKLGHEVECFCFYGLSGGLIDYDGYRCWPSSDFDPWGSDVIRAHVINSEADAVVTLLDPFVLDPNIWHDIGVPWIGWCPIDCDEIGFNTVERLKLMQYPIAMSQHGAAEMTKAGVSVAETIYHAVDTTMMYPRDRLEARKSLGVDPDCHLIGMVMANKGDRKQFSRHFEAIRMFMDNHPDEDVRMFLHTDPTDKMGGWIMPELLKKFDLVGKAYATSQYFTSVVGAPEETMANMYSSMDVPMNCSAGEGFGVPILEAQACGTPVITHNVTSMPEITMNGYGVNPSSRYLAAHYGFQYIPDIEEMAQALEKQYRMGRGNWKQIVEHIQLNFSVEAIGAQWDEVLREVTERERTRDGSGEALTEPDHAEAIESQPEPVS